LASEKPVHRLSKHFADDERVSLIRYHDDLDVVTRCDSLCDRSSGLFKGKQRVKLCEVYAAWRTWRRVLQRTRSIGESCDAHHAACEIWTQHRKSRRCRSAERMPQKSNAIRIKPHIALQLL
jgi:hypothetical protein